MSFKEKTVVSNEAFMILEIAEEFLDKIRRKMI